MKRKQNIDAEFEIHCSDERTNRRKDMKKRIAAISAVLYVTLLWWAGGIDFDTRGSDLVSCLLFAAIMSGMAFAFPFDD